MTSPPFLPSSAEGISRERRELAETVRRVRQHRGLTQQSLAALMGISQPEISRVENAQAEPGYQRVCDLFRALGVALIAQDGDLRVTLLEGAPVQMAKDISNFAGEAGSTTSAKAPS